MTERQRQLVAENHGLIYAFLKKYKLPADEYYDLAAIGLCKAAETFNPKKAKFSTFAYYGMRSMVSNELRRRCQLSRVPEDKLLYYQAERENERGEVQVLEIPANENLEDFVVGEVLIQNFFDSLKERELRILNLLKQGLTQQEVGTIVGLSQAEVSRIRARLKKQLLSLYI